MNEVKLYCCECKDVIGVGVTLQKAIENATGWKYGASHKSGEAGHVYICFDCKERLNDEG